MLLKKSEHSHGVDAAKNEWDVEDVLQKLRIEEKVALLSGNDWWHTVPVPRLDIPSIRVSDGPNGIRGTKFFDSVPSACFPCGTAIGATFDVDLAVDIGHLLAEEAKAKSAHVVLGPTINIQRGPLGGRGFESFSEDPLLSGLLAAGYCQGLSDKNIVPTLKHFVCNDQEHERLAADVRVTERALREIYLKPFQIAIRESNPQAIMTAYNKVNGVHAPENQRLLQDILRGEWGWDGIVMSDWYGTYSTSEAIDAGLDLEMPGPTRWRGASLIHAVSANKVSIKKVNERCRNVLKLVKACQAAEIEENGPEVIRDLAEDRELLRKVAADSIVLLKNEDNILPLDNSRKIAVIGSNAARAAYCGGGSAALTAYRTVTALEAISMQATNGVEFATGVCTHQLLPQIGSSMIAQDGTRGFTLSIYNEPSSATQRYLLDTRHLTTSSVMLIDYAHPRLQKVWYADAVGSYTADISGLYDFGLCVVGTGRLFVDDKLIVSSVENQRQGSAFLGLAAIEEMGTVELVAGQSYVIRMEFGCIETSKLRPEGVVAFDNGAFSFGCCRRVTSDERIREAVELARKSDQVVLVTGLNSEWETEGMDRPDMNLPPGVDDLVRAVLKANSNTVIVLQSGTPVTMPWINDAKAVLQAWYGGNEGGHGIADVLFGSTNPSAKLPVTFPRKIQDNPTYGNSRCEGGRILYGEDIYVGYRYYDMKQIEPAFHFGHGLSYTNFAITECSLDIREGKVTIKCQLKNVGSRDGAEVLQVYVGAQPPAAITCAPRQLQAFKKVYLESGEEEEIQISFDGVRGTSFWDEKSSDWCSTKGFYKVFVGNSSAGPFAERLFEMVDTTHWQGL